MGVFKSQSSNEITTTSTEKYDNSRSVGVMLGSVKGGFITLSEEVNKESITESTVYMFKPILNKDGSLKLNAKSQPMLAFYVQQEDGQFISAGLYNLMVGVKLAQVKACKENNTLSLSLHGTSVMSEDDLLAAGAF